MRDRPENRRHTEMGSDRPGENSEVMRGRLDFASPFELGQFLLLGRKTGALHLTCDDKHGVLYVLAGQIVSAVSPELHGGKKAAMELIGWKEGEFRFVPKAVAQSDEIELGTESLLLETARLMDESGAGERELAASLEKIDELSRTFAAISKASHGRVSPGSDAPEVWVNAAPGRSLFHMTGHALLGLEPGGQVTLLDEGKSPDPGRVLHRRIDGPPHNDWTQHDGARLYLSWGSEGYRLVHPFPRPSVEHHLRDMAVVGEQVDAAHGVTIYGPPNSGKSLLAALLVSARGANGGRVLYLSGVPSHDLGDGRQIFHVVEAPGSQLVAAREVLERWHPESVVADMEPSEELAAFLRNCKAGGIPIVLTLRAQDLQGVQKSIACLFDQTSGWRFLAPSQVEAGPVLEVRQCAA